MYALLDCDNFFVSCERLFHPELKARPVVVLSNNDGCVVSRSYEAKAIGIPMGAPYFKVEALLKSHQGTACSSNFGLYSDISRRIMQIIKSKHPELEIYSIDEAFIKMPAEQSLEEAMELRNMLLQNTGISVSIGIAPTKTLCKTAGSVAKKKIKDKIHFLNIPNETDALLSRQDVGEIWGIGKNLKSKLNFLGIFTALELKNTPLRLIKENFGLSLEKIVLELNNCPVLNNIHEENQSLMCTGSFEKEIFQKETLEQILSDYTASVCLRLRKRELAAAGIMTFVETNRFRKGQPFYHNSQNFQLSHFSCDTSQFIKGMKESLKLIFQNGLGYKRAGVMLLNIEEINRLQGNLFTPERMEKKEEKLMKTCDKLNKLLGTGTIILGAQSLKNSTPDRYNRHTQISINSWKQLPHVS